MSFTRYKPLFEAEGEEKPEEKEKEAPKEKEVAESLVKRVENLERKLSRVLREAECDDDSEKEKEQEASLSRLQSHINSLLSEEEGEEAEPDDEFSESRFREELIGSIEGDEYVTDDGMGVMDSDTEAELGNANADSDGVDSMGIGSSPVQGTVDATYDDN